MKYDQVNCYISEMSMETKEFGTRPFPLLVLDNLGECVVLHYGNTVLHDFLDTTYRHIRFEENIIYKNQQGNLISDIRLGDHECHLFIDNNDTELLWQALYEHKYPYSFEPLASEYIMYLYHHRHNNNQT